MSFSEDYFALQKRLTEEEKIRDKRRKKALKIVQPVLLVMIIILPFLIILWLV